MSWTSPKWKGVVSEVASVYSPGRSRKKNAMMIMSAVASNVLAEGGRCWAMKAIRLMTWIGMGLTRPAGGSSFFHAAIVRWIRKSIFPREL